MADPKNQLTEFINANPLYSGKNTPVFDLKTYNPPGSEGVYSIRRPGQAIGVSPEEAVKTTFNSDSLIPQSFG